MTVGPLEILIILVIALLIFGPNKLPELARTLGRGMREVRRLQRVVQNQLDDVLAEPEPSERSGSRRSDASEASAPPAVKPGGGNTGNGASGDGSGPADSGSERAPGPGGEPS